MISLAQNLKIFLERHFVESRKHDPNAMVRPILVGPPDAALESLFMMLSNGGSADWQPTFSPQELHVPVLLISDTSSLNGAGGTNSLSRRCHWDYAVTVRNSRPLVLMLATSTAWDNRPESLANTTETLGSPTVGRGGFRDSSWKHLLQSASASKGLEERLIRQTLQEIRKQAQSLEPSTRDRVPWEVMDRLLAQTPTGVAGQDILNAAAGFAATGATQINSPTSAAVVKALASFLGKHGFSDGIDKLANTNAAQARNLDGPLNDLLGHLAMRVLSSTDFANAPAWHYWPGDPVPTWWHTLDAATLNILLDEADDRPRVRLSLVCENAMNSTDRLPGEPFIVAQAAQLRAAAAGTPILGGATFSRKLDKAAPVLLAAAPNDPTVCIDPSPVTHNKPFKYSVSAPNSNPGTVDIIALDMFGSGGTAHVRDADKNPPPTFNKTSKNFTQHITLRRGGASEVRIYHAASAASVTIEQPGEQPIQMPTAAGSQFVTFTLDLEDGADAMVGLYDAHGTRVGGWDTTFTVNEVMDVARTRLEALIKEHRTAQRSLPRPEDTPVQRAEGTCYLASPNSWRPVVACWSSTEPGWLDIDWATPTLGDVEPQIDPRPPLNPPQALLAARDAVRQHILAKQVTVGELEFNDAPFLALVDVYLTHYLAWLMQAPSEATWLDSFAIHSAAWNAQAGHHVPSDEPVVILLSPLHPLRLAWHCIAQQQLADGLLKKCPAAGLLDPSASPDAGTWNFNTGQGLSPRAFLSLPCKNPHWAVFINQLFLSQEEERLSVLKQVSALGLDVQGVAGGFTIPQAIDSLQEVARLLPARATLRVGLVGTPESSIACSEGVIKWCTEPISDEPDEVRPFQVDVFDTREAADPSPERLAALSETTHERVKWFKLSQNAAPPRLPRLDLTIIDQLGSGSPTTSGGATRSAVGKGSLHRIRIRQDFQNAKTLSESRIGGEVLTTTTFADRVRDAIQRFEALARQDNDASQFRFRPNQNAIGNRLNNSTFLAVTSSQIDPACIVRGVSGHSGYLWDYELPGMLGGAESNVGYYLLAKPLEAMRNAVKRSAALILTPPPDPVEMLDEISRHGIPILKRLASGGSQSRGELGLLLAVRLLQDVFRGNASSARLPVWKDNCLHLVLPIDPYEEPFENIRRELCKSTTTAQRPDLLVIAIYLPPTGAIALKLTPVEVKFRGGNLPSADARSALRQAENLGKIAQSLWNTPLPNDLWGTCARALLGQCLDFAFRIYADAAIHGHTADEWTQVHQRIVQDVLDDNAQITVNVAGRLLAFDNSATSNVMDLDGDQVNDTAILSFDDARILLSGSGSLSPQANSAVTLLDFSLPWCTTFQSGQTLPAPNNSQTIASSTGALPILSEANASEPTPDPESISADTTASPPPSLASLAAEPVTARLVIPPATRQRVKDAFAGFVGNDPALARLTNDLLRALIENPPHLAKNYLFTGLPSTGKTELSRRLAVALGLPFVKLDGRGVATRDRLFDLINGELSHQGLAASQVGQQVGLPVMTYPPLIVFIDEVHLVPKGVQESLLTMLEAADRTVVLTKQVARVDKATFLFATTRASDVDPAFVTRCDEIQLREYTEEEVAQILADKIAHDWPKEIYLQLARLGRCVPRIAIQLAQGLETAVLVAEHPKGTSTPIWTTYDERVKLMKKV